jgi:tetratricopeptide (TPR) repeat protein
LPQTEAPPSYDDQPKENLGGFTARQLKRIDKKQKEIDEKKGISEELSDARPDSEPDYTAEELVLLNEVLAEAYAALGEWASSLEPYRYVIDNTKEDVRKGRSIMRMVDALVKLKRYQEAGDFLSQLYRTNARYELSVNLALIEAASSLFGAKEYDRALKLYRMVLPRGELLAYQEKKMNELRREAGLPDVVITIATNAAGRVETLFGDKLVVMTSKQDPKAPPIQLPPKPPELHEMETVVQSLAALEPYEDNVIFQIGQLYAEAGRPWEAVASFNEVTAHDPESEQGQGAFASSLMVLVEPLKEYGRVEQAGAEYLAVHNTGLGPRQVALALTICFQRQDHWKDIKELRPTIQGFLPVQGAELRRTVIQYECELYFMQALADLMLLHHQEALAGLDKVLADYKDLQAGSTTYENAVYWHAMCQLYLKNYQEAMDELNAYGAKYPAGTWIAPASFNIGVCLFGLDQNNEAIACFSRVIEKWPDEDVYSDACSMRGDLYAGEGGDMLDLAQKDYEEAIAKARTERQASYAVFQMVTMFDLDKQKHTSDEILSVVNAYLKKYEGKGADVAKATFWIGKTKLAQDKVADAVNAYCETILKYGGDVRQDGVDMIIGELVRTAKTKLNPEARQGLEARLQTALKGTDNATLQLRLRVLLAQMNGTAPDLGRQLIKDVADLTQAPPPVLSLICEASFQSKDYSRAGEILNILTTRYEETEYTRAAYKLRAYDLFAQDRYDEALILIAAAQKQYPDADWAQIMRGRAELKLGRIDEARKTITTAVEMRQWRGPARAEAVFRLGEVEEQAADLPRAFEWYQRAYVQYKGYADGYWAAEGYLASARCLEQLSREASSDQEKVNLQADVRNTYRAMLFDKYVNKLPQARTARDALGVAEVQEIEQMIAGGLSTNITVTLKEEGASTNLAATAETEESKQ